MRRFQSTGGPVVRIGLAVLIAMAGLIALPAAAQAAPAGWATFAPLAGSSRDYTTTMQQRPAGFPAAAVQTTSVGGSAVGVQTGASAFLPPQTPVGAQYGSSQGQPYLNLRPNGLNASPPSVTIYTFDRPTPATGWTFVLGDVDADAVAISATGADDNPVTAAELGFQSVFNYCAPGVTPKPSCGPPNNDGLDLPIWLPGSATLQGNADARDSAGAAAWFEPTVALNTLTFTYSQRSGSPVYQTWFSALAFDLTGTVTAPPGAADGLTVQLFDPAGNLVGTTTSDSSGDYQFPGRATYDGYRVQLVRPAGFTSDDPLSRIVDLSTADQTADFSLRAIVPAAASGTVAIDDGDPVAGVTVTATGPDGFTATTTTGADGSYLFDDLPAGDDYQVSITVPTGFSSPQTSRTFDVPEDSETPVTGLDFILAAAAVGSVSGTVTDEDGSDPVAGVEITITADGFERVVRTDGDGGYAIGDLAPGTYTITVTPPDGGTVVGAATRTVTITEAGEDVTDQDFVVAPPQPAPTYAISGTVLDPDGDPVPGSAVSLQPPGGVDPILVETTADGSFAFADQPAGTDYVATVVPPDGYEVSGDETLTFTVDDDVTGLAFVLVAEDAPSPSPTSSTAPPPTTTAPIISAPAGGDGLANTGGPAPALAVIGLISLIAGLILLRHRPARHR